MTKTATVRARVEPELKKNVEGVFSKLGLTTSDAITLFLNQVALVGGLPFPVRVPNKETLKALAEAKSDKKLKTYATVKEMNEELLK